MRFWNFHLWDFLGRHNYAFPLYDCIFVNGSPTNIVRPWIKAIGKESSSVRIHFVSCQSFCLWVLILHRRIKKGKDEIICVERLSPILFEKTFTKKVETKSIFFPEKNSCFLKKKSLNVWNEKILHPRIISVKCYKFFYLFITSNSPMYKMKYISKYFSIFCETFSNVVVACPFRGTCLQPVRLYCWINSVALGGSI